MGGCIRRSGVAGSYGNLMFRVLRNCPWPSVHASPPPPCMSILFQTHVRTRLHCDFFSWWFPAASADSCVPQRPLIQLCLKKLYFCLFVSSFASALFLSASRMCVPLPAPNCSLARAEMDTCSLRSKALVTIFAFLLLGYSSNNWRWQK